MKTLSLPILAVSLLFLFSCSSKEIPPMTQKPPNLKNKSFAQYIDETRSWLQQNRVAVGQGTLDEQIEQLLPFEIQPSCHSQKSRAVILIHGLGDSPFIMRDIANVFAKQCFNVRTLLLPGHGSHPGHLTEISRYDWQEMVHDAFNQTAQEFDEVYLGGYSLGGALSILHATQDERVKGLFLFAPVFRINSALAFLTTGLRYVQTWIDTDEIPNPDFARYENSTTQSIAETYLLTRDLKKRLSHNPKLPPTFIAISKSDSTVDAQVVYEFYQKQPLPFVHMLWFAPEVQDFDVVQNSQKRLVKLPTQLADQNIVSFSHRTIPTHPDNLHYGKNSPVEYCGFDYPPCPPKSQRLYGEFGTGPKNTKISRLLFNPHFEKMSEEIAWFIEKVESL